MYTRSAQFYDRLYHFKDYATESAKVRSWIDEHHPQAATLLDVGCATGRHLEYLQAHYACEGLDISPELLGIARRRCPNLAFHDASMIDFRLGRQFDVVTCLFSAIAMGATSKPVLDQTMSSFAAHLRPGGLLIVEPWFTPQTYWTGTITANFVNDPDLKIAWMYHSTTEAGRSVLDVQYLVGTVGSIDHFSERLECSLFEHAEYLEAFEKSGLRVWHQPEAFGRGMYLAENPDRTLRETRASIMLRERCISIDSPDEWEAAVSGLPHSVVHTWGYCRSIWLTSGRRTFLYCLENLSTRVVCPLSERERGGSTDVVTPYGIGGFTGFGDTEAVWRQWLEFAERRYVAGYVGLNPLFAEAAIQATDATREKTLYVLDLRQSTDELFAKLSSNRKRQVRSGAIQGERNLLTDRSAITEFFVSHYATFMDRKQAAQVYRLTPESLRSLCNLPTVLLIGAGRPGHIEAAAMFGHSPFSGDYLFGLSISGAQIHSALLLWWGATMMKTMGIPFLNLGGGVRDGDSLAEFKRRFGGLELPLKSLRQVYRPTEYAELCRKASADPGTTAGYFPAYHKPG